MCDSIVITWTASPFPKTDRYGVICKDSKGNIVYLADDSQIVYDGCTATVSGLDAGKTYKFEIRAVSDLLGSIESKVTDPLHKIELLHVFSNGVP